MKKVKDVAAYLALQPPGVRAQLEMIRKIVLQVVPGVEEKISYGMPAYSYHGVLLYFAATQKHIGLYAMPAAIEAFRQELKPYDTSKGTIRFPLEKRLPATLIRAIVKFRKLQNEERAAAK
jgi:uncharacterized protein YdhG (YjbR/CyaY superfamily)